MAGDVKLELPDGEYTDHYSGKTVCVYGGLIRCEGKPIIISCPSLEQF